MIRWPWMSRALHEAILSERETTIAFYKNEIDKRVAEVDRLRDEVASLIDHRRRMERLDHGVAEVPRVPKRPLEPISRLAFEHVMSWGSEAARADIRARLEARHRKGELWDDIDKSLTLEQPGNDATTATS